MPGRDHAVHNEKLCDLLLDNGNFPDWVVTTAFYSAIHLVDHQIFPLTIGAEPTFSTYGQYFNRKGAGMAPHKVRRDLVERHLGSCADAFKWLYDTCHGARYNSYLVSASIAAQAKKRLEEIKRVCRKP